MKYLLTTIGALLLMSVANSAQAQFCSFGLNFTAAPPYAYVGEFNDYGILSIDNTSSSPMRPDDSVIWQFLTPAGSFNLNRTAYAFGSGAASAVRLQIFARGISNYRAFVPDTNSFCERFVNVANLPTATIQSISGTRQNASALTFTAAPDAVDEFFSDNETYTWHFGDNISRQGRVVTHLYDLPGNYTVRLAVSDGNRTAERTQSISIAVNPDVAGQPKNFEGEYLGCTSSQQTRYAFTWQDSAPFITNNYEIQFKPSYSSSWGPILRRSTTAMLINNLNPNTYYNVRIRGCLTNNSANCGAYNSTAVNTPNCSGGGRPRPLN